MQPMHPTASPSIGGVSASFCLLTGASAHAPETHPHSAPPTPAPSPAPPPAPGAAPHARPHPRCAPSHPPTPLPSDAAGQLRMGRAWLLGFGASVLGRGLSPLGWREA